ncbi:hypothetical protein [Aliikangiella sp. IMCC44359]|uniref:hypothetical protein n=1 Tax=Aliikangiella sp. IMCC44359 TaxID=3459125 RepID=UPI00403B0FCA
MLQNSEYPNPKNTSVDNLFSEISYHSVQITCRQRIKVKQPDGKNLSFFFPYELQIMDRQSYISSREGLASHSEYKKRQRAAIRKRVLPFLS